MISTKENHQKYYMELMVKVYGNPYRLQFFWH
jgi:hypothetical protein